MGQDKNTILSFKVLKTKLSKQSRRVNVMLPQQSDSYVEHSIEKLNRLLRVTRVIGNSKYKSSQIIKKKIFFLVCCVTKLPNAISYDLHSQMLY